VTDSPSPPVYQLGDVVYGADPFKREMAVRPWLIISNPENHPFYGEQYIAMTLTTRSWRDGSIKIHSDTVAEHRQAP
jgi:mRNA interferase MazF